MPRDVLDRIMSKVSVNEAGCWLWCGSRNRDGYGHVSIDGKTVGSHLAVWRLLVGDPPEGYDLDHLCRNRACCNPMHMEPVTHRVNVLRGRLTEVQKARAAAITHCPRGHAYDEANTYAVTSRNGNPGRQCKACRKIHRDNHKAKQRDEAAP